MARGGPWEGGGPCERVRRWRGDVRRARGGGRGEVSSAEGAQGGGWRAAAGKERMGNLTIREKKGGRSASESEPQPHPWNPDRQTHANGRKNHPKQPRMTICKNRNLQPSLHPLSSSPPAPQKFMPLCNPNPRSSPKPRSQKRLPLFPLSPPPAHAHSQPSTAAGPPPPIQPSRTPNPAAAAQNQNKTPKPSAFQASLINQGWPWPVRAIASVAESGVREGQPAAASAASTRTRKRMRSGVPGAVPGVMWGGGSATGRCVRGGTHASSVRTRSANGLGGGGGCGLVWGRKWRVESTSGWGACQWRPLEGSFFPKRAAASRWRGNG